MIKKTFRMALIFWLLLFMTTTVFGAIIWQANSKTYVENTHPLVVFYEGFGFVNSSIYTFGYYYTRVAIRYRGGSSGDTGWLWTPTSYGNTEMVTKTYLDTLDPSAPVTQFSYDYIRTN